MAGSGSQNPLQAAVPPLQNRDLHAIPGLHWITQDEAEANVALRQENADLKVKERTYSLLTEISLKAVQLNVYYSTSTNNTFRVPSVQLEELLFDEHGTIDPSNFATPESRALLIQCTFLTLLRHHQSALRAVGWHTGVFFNYVAQFLPQLNLLSGAALGDQPHARRCGMETTWSMLVSALYMGVEPIDRLQRLQHPPVPWADPESEWTSITDISVFMSALLMDRMMAVEKTHDEHGLQAMYWEANVAWVQQALTELDLIAWHLAKDSGRREASYLKSVRETAKYVVTRSKEKREEAARKRER